MYTTMHSTNGSTRQQPKMSVIRSFFKGLFYCVFILQATGYISAGRAEGHDQVRLVGDLMETYNKYVRPVKNSSTIVIVDFQFFFSTVLDMDEREQTLTCATWLTLLWHDEYLVWNPVDYGGLKKIKIPAETIWLPDIYFYNNAHPTYEKFLVGTIVKIKYTGDIQWAAPVNFKGQCLLDITYFPFDRQSCDMKFGPWQHDGTELVVQGAGESTVFESNGEWDMIGLSSCNNVEYYPDDPDIPYTDVTFYINFSRRPHYYVFNLMMPSLLITLLASLAFLLPPQSQGKVQLGVTFLLSMTVFLMIVAESIPPTNTVPVIGQYFAASMLLVSMSLVLNIIVVTVFTKSSGGEPVPIWLRTLVIHILAPLVRVKTGDLVKSGSSRKRHKGKSRSGGFFRSSTREMEFERVPNDVRPHGLAFETTDVDANEKHLLDYTPNNSMDRLESIALELRRVNEILAAFGHSNPGAGPPKTPDEKKNERAWVITARVLDRLFLILYLIGNVSSLLMLVFQTLHIGVPHGKENLCHDGSEDTATAEHEY
ncbi:neuronal acetylcholine receptor subunit alpha-10-like isoform X1 [Amphiura filiformis]|uniref:neuronal acetylcholine receptor subunit alpha-10-like isoform X1 n=1 Tax=Amphiura filiformis TaxID=82378 RepID=UPI003B20C2FE